MTRVPVYSRRVRILVMVVLHHLQGVSWLFLPPLRMPLLSYAKPVNPADDLGGFVVDDPLPGVIRVFFIAVGRRAHGVASVAAQFF